MENEAWKTMFTVQPNGNGRYWLVCRKGEHFSSNMILYKTKGGATRGAKAAHNKIVKALENTLLK